MPTPIAGKLRIKPGDTLLTLNAPAGFRKALGELPEKVKVSDNATRFNQIHWFVSNRAQLEKQISGVLKKLRPGIVVWVYYPKGTSGLQTDLTRDKGWDCLLLEGNRLAWINLIAFDTTWSVFGFRAKSEEDVTKQQKPKSERVVFSYVDPKTKTVTLPEDLHSLFMKHKKEHAFFDTLSFTNKKEYIEWIVTAKREETRKQRLTGTIERLQKQWKNPRNL